MVLCSSGTHGWIDPADAVRCCNGWRRELKREEGLYGTTYSFMWVRNDEKQQRPPVALSTVAPGKLRLTIELVPRPLWGQNLAKLMPRAEWERLRGRVKALSNYRCSICGAEGTLYCHEVFQYDDVRHIQSLVEFKAICAMCHHVKHIGRAGILASEGELDLERVVEHFMRVNGCDRDTFKRHNAESKSVWKERSLHEWATDFGVYAEKLSHG